jgi:hypothetical protein
MSRARDVSNIDNIPTAKGDIYAATAASTPARIGVGSNDQVLVSDSTTSTGLAWKSYAAQQVAGKNKIINGDFSVWQRGTSFTANEAFAADRWRTFWSGSPTVTTSRQTFTPGTAPVAGYEGQYFLRVNMSAIGSSNTYLLLQQRVEDVRNFAGRTAVLSFWVKADANRSIGLGIRQNFGPGGSAEAYPSMSIGAVTATTSWQRFTTVITFPSLSGKTIVDGSYVGIDFYGVAATVHSFDIWGVQLEEGSAVATPFTPAGGGNPQAELEACQRYYWRQTSGAAYTPFANGFMQDANNGMAIVTPPVPMRIVPPSFEYSTLQIIDSSYTASGGTPAFGISESGTFPLRIYWINATGQTANRPAVVRAGNSSTAYIGFSAEL